MSASPLNLTAKNLPLDMPKFPPWKFPLFKRLRYNVGFCVVVCSQVCSVCGLLEEFHVDNAEDEIDSVHIGADSRTTSSLDLVAALYESDGGGNSRVNLAATAAPGETVKVWENDGIKSDSSPKSAEERVPIKRGSLSPPGSVAIYS